MYHQQPNKSPEPNPSGALNYSRTPVAHLVTGSGWLSFGRSANAARGHSSYIQV